MMINPIRTSIKLIPHILKTILIAGNRRAHKLPPHASGSLKQHIAKTSPTKLGGKTAVAATSLAEADLNFWFR